MIKNATTMPTPIPAIAPVGRLDGLADGAKVSLDVVVAGISDAVEEVDAVDIVGDISEAVEIN